MLHLWLDNLPEYTVGFCRLVLLSTMLYMITSGLSTAVDATGNIKWMYICLGCLHVLNLPVGYLLLYYGFSAYSVLWLVVCEEMICMCARIGSARYIVGISVDAVLKKVIQPIMITTGLTLFIGVIIVCSLESSFMRLVVTFMSCMVASLASIWHYGAEQPEKERIKSIIYNIKYKLVK